LIIDGLVGLLVPESGPADRPTCGNRRRITSGPRATG